MHCSNRSLRKNKRAVSPAISTVMITGVIVALLMVTVVYANDFLSASIAKNEYRSSQQFMLTTGLQVDDVAWTIGRTETVRYSSKYGHVAFEPSALTYTFEVSTDGMWHTVLTTTTGIVLFNMPTSMITYGNDYFDRIFPLSSDSFLQNGSAVPVAHVFAVEKLDDMTDGSYTRVVVAPSIRMLAVAVGSDASYTKFFLPSLGNGSHLSDSQSISVIGNDVSKLTEKNVDMVRISVTFPSQGFDSTFFNFAHESETVDVQDDSVVEFYTGKVDVLFGMF